MGDKSPKVKLSDAEKKRLEQLKNKKKEKPSKGKENLGSDLLASILKD